MRPAVSGRMQWDLLSDLLGSVQTGRDVFEANMRCPKGHVQKFLNGDTVRVPFSGETSEHMYMRKLAHMVIYAHNSVLSGSHNLNADFNNSPTYRFNTLALVNQMRTNVRGLDPIDPRMDVKHEGGFYLSREECNKIQTFRVAKKSFTNKQEEIEEYDIVYCRHTEAEFSKTLKEFENFQFFAQQQPIFVENNVSVQATSSSSSTTTDTFQSLHLKPSFYDSEIETWRHRAVGFYESMVCDTKRQVLNECRQCKWCFLSISHAPSSSCIGAERVNVCHKKTLQDFSDQMLYSFSILAPCSMCRYHFSNAERDRYWKFRRARYTYPYNILRSLYKETQDSEYLKVSDYFALDVVKMALYDAIRSKQEAPSSSVIVKRSLQRSSDASSSNQRAESSSRQKLGQLSTEDKKLNIVEVMKKADSVADYIEQWWTGDDELIAQIIPHVKESWDFNAAIPMGFILHHFVSASSSSSRLNSRDFDTCGSILFPSIPQNEMTYLAYIYNLKNSINATTLKPYYEWHDFNKIKTVFGQAVTNPSHIWPLIISIATSIGYSKEMSDEELNLERTAARQEQYDQFYASQELDEKTRWIEFKYPFMKKLYKIAAKVDSTKTYEKPFETFIAEDGSVPLPHIPAEVFTRMNYKLQTSWYRNKTMLDRVDGEYIFYQNMKSGRVPCGLDLWKRYKTANAQIKALDSYLESLTALCACNPHYKSLVSFIWPIPKKFAKKVDVFLLNSMWSWYILTNQLLQLVQDTLIVDYSSKHRCKPEDHCDYAQIMGQMEREKMYAEFCDEMRKNQDHLNDESWRMPTEWMNRFWNLWLSKMRFELMFLNDDMQKEVEEEEEIKA